MSEVAEMVKPDQKQRDIALVKSTLNVCVKTIAILEYTKVVGKDCKDMYNALLWLASLKQGLKLQLEELEKTK